VVITLAYSLKEITPKENESNEIDGFLPKVALQTDGI